MQRHSWTGKIYLKSVNSSKFVRTTTSHGMQSDKLKSKNRRFHLKAKGNKNDSILHSLKCPNIARTSLFKKKIFSITIKIRYNTKILNIFFSQTIENAISMKLRAVKITYQICTVIVAVFFFQFIFFDLIWRNWWLENCFKRINLKGREMIIDFRLKPEHVKLSLNRYHQFSASFVFTLPPRKTNGIDMELMTHRT